jgi:hypothetical protein
MNFAQAVDAYAYGLRPLCGTLNEMYLKGLAAKDAAAAESAARMVNGVPDWTGAPREAMEGFLGARDGQFAAETIAEAILRLCDDALFALAHQIRRPVTKSINTKSGRKLAGGVAVDELLDAFGNAPRHRAEWRLNPRKSKKTIKTLARFYAGKSLTFTKSLDLLRTENEQALKILEALAPGSPESPAVNCDALLATVRDTGNAIIDEHWPHWARRTNLDRAIKRREIVAIPADPNHPTEVANGS